MINDLFAQAIGQSADLDSDVEHNEQFTSAVEASVAFDLDDPRGGQGYGLSECIEIPDEDKPFFLETDQPILSPPKALKSKRSAPVGEIPVRAAPKRKCDKAKILQLDEVTLPNGSEVSCVIIKKFRGCAAVPLYRQYRASWGDINFAKMRWIVVGTQEVWLLMLVDHHTKKSCRDVAKTLVDHCLKEFRHCVTTARKANGLDDDDDGDDSPLTERRHTGTGPRLDVLIQIKLGTYTLTALNSRRRMALLVDACTVDFVTGWLLPLLKQIVEGTVAIVPTTEALAPSQDSPEDSQGFQLTACGTPNFRDKVCWCPAVHTWKVYIQKPKAAPCKPPLCGTMFSVSPHLGPDAYDKEKIEKYWLAVQDWNRCDSSSRHRIPYKGKKEGVAVETEGGATGAEEGATDTTD